MSADLLILLATAAAQPPAGHVHSGDGYKVTFPGPPKVETPTAKTPLGELKVHTATYATDAGNIFLLSRTDYPAGAVAPDDLPGLYDRVRDGLKGKDGKVVSEKDVAVGPGKVPGKEVVVDRGKRQARFRVVAKGDRLFQVAAVGAGEWVTGPEATAFLDSFEPAK
ncbi:MAG: hypothetical protein K2X87_05670 [Gemmataceae bacterium]|nr:hypothetical protein [Gemmataceae bacterium]